MKHPTNIQNNCRARHGLRLKLITAILLLVCCCHTHAQFRGGIGSGSDVGSASSQPLGRNIFRGGADDGTDFFLASNQPMGRNIFKGGADDGIDVALAANQPMGRNIFKGGADDGTDVALAANQPMGRNIFRGGADDGTDMTQTSNQPLGRNIFTGGIGDGFALAFAANVSLPVTLKNFNAEWKSEDVLSKWVTTNELNTDYFEVERSINSTTFVKVGKVTAAGNSTTEKTYTFTDTKVNSNYTTRPAYSYYRLKTIDKDGHVSYSAIVALPNQNKQQQFVLYPNPAQSFVTLEFKEALDNKKIVLRLMTADGKALLQKTVASTKEIINVTQYASGIYYLQIIEENNPVKQSIKLIIQH